MKRLHFAAALGVAAWALGLAATGAASAEEGKAKPERLVVVTERQMPAEDGEQGPRLRAFTLVHGAASCTGQKDEVDQQSQDGKEKTHIVFCASDTASPAERAGRLEKALARIEQNDALSAEHKARVVAALRAEIDRLNAAH